MAGMLEALLSGFGGPDMTYRVDPPPLDESAIVQQAAEAAAKRQKRGVIAEPPPFNAPAVPFSGMGMLASGAPLPGWEGTPVPPETNDPTSGQPEAFKGGVPVPRPRPSEASGGIDDVSSQAQVPGAPMSLAPPMAPQAQSAAAPDGGVLGGLGGGLSKLFGNITKPENAPLLFALAGGFAGAPSVGTGMRRAFSAAAPAAMQNIQLQQKLGTQSATYKALIAKGVPPNEALSATLDPNVMKAVAAKYFETKPFTVHDTTDALGNKTPLVFDANTGRFRDMAGRPIEPGQSSAAGAGVPSSVALAPGITFDPQKTGDDYLEQFSPDVKAAVRAYMSGDVMPTGNARQQSLNTFAKTIAQRYGQDMGIPVSDATFSEKRKYRMELGSNSANSAGGQAKAFNQGIEHADALATKLEKLGNVDPLGIPAVASSLNATRQAFSTKQSGLAKEASAIGQTLAGEVGKLFSGSAGGGVHERELTRNRFNTVSSPTELAGALEGTLETMEGGLKALEQRRDSVLGANNNVQLVSAETQAKMARIREVISRLKGETAAPTAAPAGKTGSGISWSVIR